MKKILRFLISRTFWLSLLIIVQLGIFAMILLNISRFSNYLYLAFVLLSLAIVIWLVAKDDNPSYKITWIILIMTLPVLGGVFYLKFGNKTIPSRYREKMESHRRSHAALYTDDYSQHDDADNIVDYRGAYYRRAYAALEVPEFPQRLHRYADGGRGHYRADEQRLVEYIAAHGRVRYDIAVDGVHQEAAAQRYEHACQRDTERHRSGFQQVAEVGFKSCGEHQDNYAYLGEGLYKAVRFHPAEHSLTDYQSREYLPDHLRSLQFLCDESHQLCRYEDYRKIFKAFYHKYIPFYFISKYIISYPDG